jgi:predicted membrane-bound mannosyltransferase
MEAARNTSRKTSGETSRESSGDSAEVISPASIDWRMAGWGVLAFTAILYFTRLGARALWASEFRWAEIAREMIRTGNYFWPTINGHLYYDKPLGSYWLVLASTFVTGGLNETAARLPCAITGLLAVGLLILLTRRLYDLRIHSGDELQFRLLLAMRVGRCRNHRRRASRAAPVPEA